MTFALGEVKDAAGNPVDFRPNYELFYDDDTGHTELITWDEDPEEPKTGIITISQDEIVDGRTFRLNYNVFARGYEPVLGGMDIQAYAEPTVTLSVDKKTIRYGETVTFTVNAPGATSAWATATGARSNSSSKASTGTMSTASTTTRSTKPWPQRR